MNTPCVVLTLALAIACKVTAGTSVYCPPSYKTDLVVVVDISSSMGEETFKDVLKPMIAKLAQVLPIGPDQTRMGVVGFAKIPRILISLDQGSDPDELNEDIQSMSFKGGFTSLPMGLCKFKSLSFRPDNDVRQVVIVITKGKTTSSRIYSPCRGQTPEQIAAEFKDGRKIIYGIGMHDNVEENAEINALTTNLWKLKDTDNVEDTLINIVMGKKECPDPVPIPSVPVTTKLVTTTSAPVTTPSVPVTTKPPPPPCPSNYKTDLVVIVDISSSMGEEMFDYVIKPMLFELAEMLPIGNGQSRMGVIGFANIPRILISLDQGSDKDELLEKIPRMKFKGGLTSLPMGLCKCKRLIFRQEKDVKHVVIVITKGKTTSSRIYRPCKGQTAEQIVAEFKDGRKIIYGIGMQENIEENSEINALTNNLWKLKDTDSVKETLLNIVMGQKECPIVTTTSAPVTTPSVPVTTKLPDIKPPPPAK